MVPRPLSAPRVVWIAILALVLLAGGMAWFLRGYRRTVVPAQPTSTVDDDINFRLSKSRIIGISEGKIAWEIRAEHFDFLRNRPVIRISGLKKIAVLNNGVTELTLTADTLERNTITNKLDLLGQVTIYGKSLLLRTQTVSWEPATAMLRLPQRISAQLGDYTLTCEQGALYDLTYSTLSCAGGIILCTQGNTLQAGTLLADIKHKQYTLQNGVTATLRVADLEKWLAGHALPQIPPIPAGVQHRYREYCRRREAEQSRVQPNAPIIWNHPPSPPVKGDRP